MVAMSEITEFARRVAERFNPDRIILFGSHAYGSPDADSDVDLLVVMPYDGTSWQKAVEITAQVRARSPLDLLVRSPEEVRTRMELGDPFLKEIVTEGRVLYESAHV